MLKGKCDLRISAWLGAMKEGSNFKQVQVENVMTGEMRKFVLLTSIIL